MPTFHVHFAADRDAPYVPLEAMQKVEAEDPGAAVQQAPLKAKEPPIGGEQIWARVVIGTKPNGNWQVVLIRLDRSGAIPYNFEPPGR